MGNTKDGVHIALEENSKSQFQTNTTDLPRANGPHYSISGIENGDVVEDVYSKANPPRPGFTRFDQKDMYRMGKIQRLRRNYRPLSAWSFAVVLTAVWEFLMMANSQGLMNGGLAGVFWSYIWTFVGFGFVIMSLAEMSSMAPISGGQYHWVSEFAPPKYQKVISYLTGWMSVLSWQAGNASGSFLTGTIIQALITVNKPDYEPQAYQGTLLVFACVAVIFSINFWGSHIWPYLQNGLMVLHVLGFLITIIVLWVCAPHRTPRDVWLVFTSEGGWPNIGISLMVGQITAIYSLLGSDATAHMAEEVRDAGRYVPMSIFWSYTLNGVLAIIFLTTYLFSLSSVPAALADPSGYPFLYIFRTSISLGGVNALTILLLILVLAANISFNASTARQTFAFARDNGLPFAKWIGQVHPTKEIPANAIMITCICTCLLSLINLGSDVAFHAIISLQVSAIMLTYGVSIACILYRRITQPHLIPVARWSLGRWGVAVNCIGLAYVSFVFFWSFWPQTRGVTLQTFNWAVVLFSGVAMGALVMFVVSGRWVYQGPVKGIRAARLE